MAGRTTHIRAVVVLAAMLVAGGLLTSPAGASTPARLRASLAAQMAKAGRHAGAYVVDLRTGRTLYRKRAGLRLVPASLEKLYTTAAALIRLGPDRRLSTTVRSTGWQVGSTWHGDLYLRGAGDFTFGSASFARRAYGGGGTVQELAAGLKRRGIRQVDGSVRADASLFSDNGGIEFPLVLCDRPLFGPGCPYGPAGKLTRPLPNGPRTPVTVDRGLVSDTSAEAQTHPARFAAHRLIRAMRHRGIRVDGQALASRTPPGARTLARTRSPRAARLAALTNQSSDNYAAETLFRVLGARAAGTGSRATGARAVRRVLARRFHLHPRIFNGSGESPRNRTSPRQLVHLLTAMRHRRVGPAFRRSLAVVGRLGTVSERLRGTAAAGRCDIKDGTLTTPPKVVTVAGYCRAAGGHLLAFAIMTNGLPIHYDAAERAIHSPGFGIVDRMMAAIARLRD